MVAFNLLVGRTTKLMKRFHIQILTNITETIYTYLISKKL